MQNLKIRVNSKSKSKEVMGLLDMAGYKKGTIDNISKPCWIAVLDGKEYSDYMLSKSTWYTANPKEITIPELRAMAEPKMKEYLIPDRNYEYILTDAREGLEPHANDWIEIPEGAECSTKCKDHNNDEWLLFWKGDYKFCVGHDKEWFYFESGVSEYLDEWRGLAKVIWQREQDEPFLTPECTLNDQYAEIEKVRQLEIHGTVKANPDFNFGAAQAVGGVDATLSQRQSQYGCYEDVAHVTQQILSALRIGNYDELPAPMKESLHMIASKMARIVNGDPEYLDNWHDIGGYAKLIEKLIKGE